MAKSYVLLDLESINVQTITTKNDTIVFCDSIKVKKRENQSFDSIDDWSNIIIGDSKYNDDIIVSDIVTNNDNGSKTVTISTISDDGTVTLKEGIGLWSVILFETVKGEDGTYTELGTVISESSTAGGSGTGDTRVKAVYYNDAGTEYATEARIINDFLVDILGNTDTGHIFNGCIFIDYEKCGIFLNISPLMFNGQTNLKRISLTNTIVYISEPNTIAGVFSECSNLVNANIPEYLGCYKIIDDDSISDNTIRIVPKYYFHNCKLLENITIPDGIVQIGFSAFYGCDSVETIDIPSSVLTVFSNSLLTVNREGDRYINVKGDTLKSNIIFFSKSIGCNKPLDNEIQHCKNTVIIRINDRGEVKFNGSNDAKDTSFVDTIGADSKIYIDCEKISGVSVGNTINSTTSFYYGGFIGTTFKTIYIGSSVKEICNFAFYNVTGTNLIINNNNILNKEYTDNTSDGSLESNKYQDGTYLIKTPFAKSNFNKIDILNCEKISNYALHSLNSNKLTLYENEVTPNVDDDLEITNTTSLTTLSDYVFYNSSFGEIIIPSTVISISNTSFLQTKGSLVLNCNIGNYTTTVNQNEHKHNGILINSEFSKITFDYIGSIPENILYENKSINSIELGEKITEIFAKAFYLCTELSNTLTIPSSLEHISSDAFIGCRFNNFVSVSNEHYQTDDSGMYLLKGSTIVLFANRHANIQIVDNTFDIIKNDNITGIGDYAFAYGFSDYANSTAYAVTIPETITNFGGNVFYNCNKLTRITFYPDNIAGFNDIETNPKDINVHEVSQDYVSVHGSFSDLPLLKEVYLGYAASDVLLYNSIPKDTESHRNNFLHNTLRNSYTNDESDISKITIYVYEVLVETYKNDDWGLSGYKIGAILKDVPPPPPVPPVENDDSYDADIDDPEGEEWPWDGGNGNISDEEDYIPPIVDSNTTTEENDDNWIKPNENNNGFIIPIKQLGMPTINVYGCRLDLLNPTYYDNKVPTNTVLIDDFGTITLSALDYLKFNKVSNENKYGSDTDEIFKIYLGDYGNNFLVIFTVTGIDNFDATTNLFTSSVDYSNNKETNWLDTKIVRIVEAGHHNSEIETLDTEGETSNDIKEKIYFVVLLCTCLKLQTKDNYNCRTAKVTVNYGSQMLDSNTNVDGQITTKIKILQHKTELRLSNNSREINITDLPVLFCQQTEHTEFTGNFFIGFPKNFWSIGNTIDTDGTSTNKNKLREYINDYFRILYDKEKIKVVGQKTKIGELDYTYIFDVADDKYANIKEPGSTNNTLMTFNSCKENYVEDKLSEIHEEYYYVNFKIENLKTSLAGGNWKITIYNIGEPAEMLEIDVKENQTDIPNVSVLWGGEFTADTCSTDEEGNLAFSRDAYNTETCYPIDDLSCVRLNLALPAIVTGIPTYYKGNVPNKIYPSIEIVDLCVDKSVVNLCGMSLLGNNTGNIYNAFTTKVGGTTLNMGISSNYIRSSGLNNVKFRISENIKFKPSLYNFNVTGSQYAREDLLNDCSRESPIVKIKREGDGENPILENSETYIYYIDTGYSALKNIDKKVYNNYLSSTNQINGQVELCKNSVDDAEGTIKHLEISETGVYIEAIIETINNSTVTNHYVLTDTFYNVLAPVYPYVSIDTYNDIETIDINTNVKLSENCKTTYINENENLTYYCATYDDNKNGFLVDGYDNLYILKNADGNPVSIWNKSINNGHYSCGLLDYKLNENVYAYQCFTITDNSTLSGTVEVDLPNLGNSVSENDFDNITKPTDDKALKIIKYCTKLTYSYELKNKTGTVVQKFGLKYYDIDNNELIDNIENDLSIKIEKCDSPNYYIYIPEQLNYGYIVTVSTPSESIDINVAENDKDDVYYGEIVGRYIKYDGGLEKWYKIYEPGEIVAHYSTIDDYYITHGYNNIKDNIHTDYVATELTSTKYNITPKNKTRIHPELFRQVFYHLYYEINDNGTKIKVYDDNDQNSVLHLRLITNYTYTQELPFEITNIFGISTDLNLSVDNNFTWQTPNAGVIFKP